jgi:hypothetical protein
MNKWIAIGLACCLPTGLAAEDPGRDDSFLGTVNVLVIEETAPLAKDVLVRTRRRSNGMHGVQSCCIDRTHAESFRAP